MGCNCASSRTASRVSWTHYKPDGSSKTYSTEIEANAALSRYGGTVKKNG